MRAKNEFRFLAEAYDTKLVLERIVDGKLMCPEACCGAPVVECTCGEDCPHCNCFMIHKAMKNKDFTDKLLKEGIVPEDERDEPIRKRPEDNEEPKRGITGYQHTDALAQAALSKDYLHKPYVSSYVGGESDGFRKIFAVLGSDGKIAYKTRDKKEAHQWLKDNYDNI